MYNKPMKILITIPVYNESKAIGGLVKSIKAKGHDVLVIDDGSDDSSGLIAEGSGAAVVYRRARGGKGLSLKEGFAYALKNGYDGVITMDGDGQHAVEDIGKFIRLAQEHPDSVITSNRMNDARKMPLLRFVTNWSMSALISLLCRQRIPDTQCGFRYIGANVLKNIVLTCDSYEVETEVLIKTSKKGFPILSVDVETIYSDEASHINPFKDTLRFFKYIVREMFSKT